MYARSAFLVLLLGACNYGGAGPSPDAASPDAAVPDAAVSADGGAHPTSDASSPVDSGSGPDAAPLDHATYEDTTSPVALALRAQDRDALTALEAKLRALNGLTGEQLLADRQVGFSSALGYDPRTAQGLALIQASPLRLNEAELAKLSAQGFAIAPRTAFKNMAEGLVNIYAADLPVYVSLDAILDAVHISYDAILEDIELAQLISDLRTLLTDARARLGSAQLPAQVSADLDLYFTVALSLLDTPVAPLRSENAQAVSRVVAQAVAADGIAQLPLFGVTRDYDFSQFKPRGHYTDSEELSRYFRAMIWLGRTDFRLIETQGDGSSVFHRRQFEAMLALASLVQGEGRRAYDHIDAVVSAFVGEHDYMPLGDVAPLVDGLGDVAALDDQTLAQKLIDSGYGAQRIASQVVYRPENDAPAYPLGRSFALLGQRFVVDAQVFSNVVWDRVPELNQRRRALPSGLDVAYAALANTGALALLADELSTYGYAPQLEAQRIAIDAYDDTFWDQNLYNVWLSALRVVSPSAGAQDPGALGRPAVTGSEAWNRRLLNTQLGSWAELRHDTILYAKQSYSGGVTCEFPDGYVDPYPQAFARIEVFANKGAGLADLLGAGVGDRARLYFADLAQVAATLRTMAEQEATGVPFDAAQLSFLNDAVRSQIIGCGGPASYQGWYARLLYRNSADEMDPTIADVHTDPGGDHEPQVLYAATGMPRLMVVTRESCQGPRAYAGVVFAYHEFAQEFPRLNDQDWVSLAASFADPEFLKPILP